MKWTYPIDDDRVSLFILSALHPRADDALDEVALREHEQREQRQHHDRRARHQQIPLCLVFVAEQRQCDLHRPHPLRIRDDQRQRSPQRHP